MKLTPKETATVLAALRFFQARIEAISPLSSFRDIATDNGKYKKPLTIKEIDALCVRLNCAPRAPRVLVICDGGLVQCVLTDHETDYAVLDYDVEGADFDEGIRAIPQGEGERAQPGAFSGFSRATFAPGQMAEIENAPVYQGAEQD